MKELKMSQTKLLIHQYKRNLNKHFEKLTKKMITSTHSKMTNKKATKKKVSLL
jgi:hypothetical protein